MFGSEVFFFLSLILFYLNVKRNGSNSQLPRNRTTIKTTVLVVVVETPTTYKIRQIRFSYIVVGRESVKLFSQYHYTSLSKLLISMKE